MQTTNATYVKILLTVTIFLIIPSIMVFTPKNQEILPTPTPINDSLVVIPLYNKTNGLYAYIPPTPTPNPTYYPTITPTPIPSSDLKPINPSDLISTGSNLMSPTVSCGNGLSVNYDDSYFGRGYYYNGDKDIFNVSLYNTNVVNIYKLKATASLKNENDNVYVYKDIVIDDSKTNVPPNSGIIKRYIFKPSNLKKGKYMLSYNITANDIGYCNINIEICII